MVSFPTLATSTTHVEQDIFSCHAVSGAVGLLLTGIFAQSSVTFNDAYSVVPGGWLDHNYVRSALREGFQLTFGPDSTREAYALGIALIASNLTS
jgi:ammonia channel protein AmtB